MTERDPHDEMASKLIRVAACDGEVALIVFGVNVDGEDETAESVAEKLTHLLAVALRDTHTRASAEGEARGEARGLERAAREANRIVMGSPTERTGIGDAIRALRMTPDEPARSYEDGVRDGLGEAEKACNEALSAAYTGNASDCVHSIRSHVRALRAEVPRG